MILTIAFESKIFKGGMDGVTASSAPGFTTNLPQPLNEDITIGDLMFYTPLTPNGGFGTAELSDLVRIGEIVDIREQVINPNQQELHTFNEGANAYQDQVFRTEIDVEWDNVNIAAPGVDDFYFFQKSNVVNSTSLVGYYADVKFVNNSSRKAELFSVGSEISESSR
tara:strand:- start:1011 stop:1511 length:501 start_codon:yes stop_codon:yes gene_type:complete